MKILISILAITLCALQYQILFGQSGYFAKKVLAQQLQEQQQRFEQLKQRNLKMTAEVLALRANPAAFEARARSELGLVKDGEIFYLVPDAADRGE
jgi:cell division protein FtsB